GGGSCAGARGRLSNGVCRERLHYGRGGAARRIRAAPRRLAFASVRALRSPVAGGGCSCRLLRPRPDPCVDNLENAVSGLFAGMPLRNGAGTEEQASHAG